MPHSLSEPGAGEALPYLKRLWRILLAPDVDPRTKLERLLEHEAAEFDLEYAFLSHIDLENETERFEITHGSHPILKPGSTVALPRTYCRKTIAEPTGTMAITDALAEGWAGDPAYETIELGSYLGTTVSIDDDLYGTLCFANTAARDEPFVDGEKAVLEMHGQWIEYTLALWDEPLYWGTGMGPVEDRPVASDAIDSMMDALKTHSRRVVLMALLDAPEIGVSTLEDRIGHENTRIRLKHSDLPRLTSAGYITWDESSDTVARGPSFHEVEPLVKLLTEYNATRPG